MDLDKRRQAALKAHHSCPGCGGMFTLEEKDGKDCGGLPGITYKVCRGCGHARAKTRKTRKPAL